MKTDVPRMTRCDIDLQRVSHHHPEIAGDRHVLEVEVEATSENLVWRSTFNDDAQSVNAAMKLVQHRRGLGNVPVTVRADGDVERSAHRHARDS
ncbi:MAG: hypothetical protein ACM3SS_23745 [Rhodospirillaceae bacterium]